MQNAVALHSLFSTGASLQMRSLDGQIASMLLLEAFVRDGELELADFYPAMLRASLSMFVVSEERLLHAAWDCLNTIVKVRCLHFSRVFLFCA